MMYYIVAWAVQGVAHPSGEQVFRVISTHRSRAAAECRAKREAGVPLSGLPPSSPVVLERPYSARRGQDL